MINTNYTSHNIIYQMEKLNKGLFLFYDLLWWPTLYNMAKVR